MKIAFIISIALTFWVLFGCNSEVQKSTDISDVDTTINDQDSIVNLDTGLVPNSYIEKLKRRYNTVEVTDSSIIIDGRNEYYPNQLPILN